ncbi:MAG: hypothetical protein D8M52_09125 [Chlorobi bacterium]|nr:hypothetical protein [Chlorobiota bacterium]NOG68332.1 hypothetical protein [Chlorobiota bacterium]WKZ78500.1 MAG: hypothetical protein QY319_03570 [Candidatus Kapabacteria bacterium]
MVHVSVNAISKIFFLQVTLLLGIFVPVQNGAPSELAPQAAIPYPTPKNTPFFLLVVFINSALGMHGTTAISVSW